MSEEVKKGRKSWKPSNLGDVVDKESGYRYRWVRKDEENIAKKSEEGWEFVSKINSPKTKAIHPEGRPDEPNQLTSNIERRDGILMRLDEDTAKLRDEYVNAQIARTEKRLSAEAKSDLAKAGGSMHGEIIKERKGVRTTI